MQKLLSNKNDVNAVIASSVHPNFCFSQSTILAASTCIAHSVSSDSALGKGLASALACSYLELQQMWKMSLDLFSPGSFVAYFNQSNRYLCNFLTKRQFFDKPTYGTLELSLQALKQHLKRRNIQEVAIPKLGCGYDQLHWATVLPFYLKFFRAQTSQLQYSSLRDSLACQYTSRTSRQLFLPQIMVYTVENLG